MPRKQNGFGSTKSFSVGSVSEKIDTGKGVRGTGQYPSNRRYGTSITRSAVEQWNIDSTWLMWRRGYEYARQNIWMNLDVFFNAYLFSGTQNRVEASFICKRFPSLKNDTATRYVLKRQIIGSTEDPRFATVTKILNNPSQNLENLQNREIWLQVNPSKDPLKGPTINRFTNLRITNKRHGFPYTEKKTFEATVKTILTSEGKPQVYTATRHEGDTRITLRVPKDDILNTDYAKENGLDAFIGQVIRFNNYVIGQPKDSIELIDNPYTVDVNFNLNRKNVAYWIADVSGLSPLEIFVDAYPLIIAQGTNSTAQMNEKFKIEKQFYQQYFDYELTASTVYSQTSTMDVVIPALYIEKVAIVEDEVVFTTSEFEAHLFLYADDPAPYIVLSDFSFSSWQQQDNGDTWNDTTVYPWQDETFLVDDGIYIADTYSCNCQSFAKGTVTSPEAEYRKYAASALNKNRQDKYPMPSALANKDPEGFGNKQSGLLNSWASRRDKLNHRLCKHVIAAIFAEEVVQVESINDIVLPGSGGLEVGANKGYKVLEPNTFPGNAKKQEIEEKLQEDTKNTSFQESGPRAEISPNDFAFSLLHLLGVMDGESGDILAGRVPLIPVTSPETKQQGVFID